MPTGAALDRLAMRARPAGSPVMHQNWERLLFLHWPVAESTVRPLIPDELEIDTFDDKAWIGITPFSLTGLHLGSLPEVPGLDAFLELNVRTYVHYRGMPGVWFFSLDASKLIPSVAARLLFALPYYKADMEFTTSSGEFHFASRRSIGPPAAFEARWRTGLRLREPALASLAFFLVERYALFSHVSGKILMTRVYHHPWILDEAVVRSLQSSMISPLGLPEPQGEPLAHFAESLSVDVWAPSAV